MPLFSSAGLTAIKGVDNLLPAMAKECRMYLLAVATTISVRANLKLNERQLKKAMSPIPNGLEYRKQRLESLQQILRIEGGQEPQ